MRTLRTFLLLLLAAGSVACEAEIPEGRFACASNEDCPPEMVCRPERARCFATLAEPDEPDGG